MESKVTKKHYDKETFKWLTDKDYYTIIEKEKLSHMTITERFRTIVMFSKGEKK